MRYSGFGDFLFETGLRGAMEHGMGEAGSVLFIDFCRVADKYPFLNELALSLAPLKLHVLDGRTNPHPDKELGLASFIHPPRNVYYLKDWTRAPKEPQEFGSKFPRLSVLADNFAALNGNYTENIDSNIIEDCVETAFFFAYATLRILAPKVVIIWNAFHPLSQASVEAARLAGIPVLFAEYGLLPGTINIDAAGQMGASAVTRSAADFNALPTGDEDLIAAGDMLEFLQQTGLNRRAQHPPGDLPHRIATAANGRPVVFYAGHNDFSSGVMPYDDAAQAVHSPYFRTSNDAADFLHRLAVENDWLLVNKPHPFNLKSSRLRDGPNCFCVGDENINACIDAANVTVTVLSQSNYVSLIRDTPVVMLGHNQANGSGAVYVPQSKDEICTDISVAIDNGLTTEQKGAFQAHVARLSTNYLYRYHAGVPRQITTADIGQLGSRIRAMIDAENVTDPFLFEPQNKIEGGESVKRRTQSRIVEIHESSEL